MLANHPTVLGRAPTASSLQIGNVDGPADGISTDNALVRWNGTTGRLVQNGVVTEADFTGTLTGPTDQSTTSATGSAFTNQPANDGIEVLSANAGDTTQTVTIIGTTNGTDTVVVETVTLNGTTAVPTVKTDWGIVLAVKKSATTLGTVTVREASADQTITAGLTAAVLSVGVTTVTNTAAYNRAVSMVADAATTKQFGFQGTDSTGTVIYDSQNLTGTTATTTNSSFLTITELYKGDLEAARTVTITTNGGWTLTGGAGATVSFDTLTGSITATPASTGGLVVGSGVTQAGFLLHVGKSSAGSSVTSLTENLSTAASSPARHIVRVATGAAATSDPYFAAGINGSTTWYMGLDNSASDQFIIGTDVPGVADLLVISTAGEVSMATGQHLSLSGVGSGNFFLGAASAISTYIGSTEQFIVNGTGATVTGTGTLKFGGTANATIGVSANTTSGAFTFTIPTAEDAVMLVTSATQKTTNPVFRVTASANQSNQPIAEFTGRTSSPKTFQIFQGGTNMQIGTTTSDPLLIFAGSNSFTLSTTAGQYTGASANMTFTAGTGNSRQMFLQTTTSGGVATTWVSANDTQDATFVGHINESTDTLSGAGAVSVTTTTTKYTSTGGAQALTLADGTNGQIKRVIHDVDGGSGILTPTTKTGYTTVTFTNAGDSVSMQFVTTRGWIITSSFGVTIA